MLKLCVMLIASLLVSLSATAQAEKRVALVIGNAAYVNIPRLANPASDASLMADTLKAVGFTLVGDGPQLDLDEAGLRRAVQAFGTQLQGADVALFYYAGHGLQVRGANYLVPIGANPAKESDVDFQMLDTNLVLRQMESAGTRLNVVILDACRNNPFGGRGLRSSANGLVQITAPEGTLISFATQPGNVALDGEGANSPYTRALAQTLRRPGLDIFQTFNEVGLAVKRTTGGAQQPWVSSSPIAGSFYFAGAPATGGAPFDTRPGAETRPPPGLPPVAARPPDPLPARPPRPQAAGENCASLNGAAGLDRYCASSALVPQFGNSYGVRNLFAGSGDTAWVEGRPGQGFGEWVVVEFDGLRTIQGVVIQNGYQKDADIFSKNSRVRQLRVVFSQGQSRTFTLQDRQGEQTLTLEQPIKAYWVQFVIVDVYPGNKYTDTAISKLRIVSQSSP